MKGLGLVALCLPVAGLAFLANQLPHAVDALAPKDQPAAVGDGISALTGAHLLRQLRELEQTYLAQLPQAPAGLTAITSPAPEVSPLRAVKCAPLPAIVAAWSDRGRIYCRRADGSTWLRLDSGTFAPIVQPDSTGALPISISAQ